MTSTSTKETQNDKDYLSADSSEWNYPGIDDDAPAHKKIHILSKGNISIQGNWEEDVGNKAWAPLLKRNKTKEKLQEYVPFVLPHRLDEFKQFALSFVAASAINPNINEHLEKVMALFSFMPPQFVHHQAFHATLREGVVFILVHREPGQHAHITIEVNKSFIVAQHHRVIPGTRKLYSHTVSFVGEDLDADGVQYIYQRIVHHDLLPIPEDVIASNAHLAPQPFDVSIVKSPTDEGCKVDADQFIDTASSPEALQKIASLITPEQ